MEFAASTAVPVYWVAAVPVPNPSGSTSRRKCDTFFGPGTALRSTVIEKFPTSPVSATRHILSSFLIIPLGRLLVLGTVKLPLLLPHTRKSLLPRLEAFEIETTLFAF